MLHNKFHENQPAGSREEDFEGFTIYGISWSCDQDHVDKFSFPCT